MIWEWRLHLAVHRAGAGRRSAVLLEGAVGWAASGAMVAGVVGFGSRQGRGARRAESRGARHIPDITTQEAARMAGERQRHAIDADLHWGICTRRSPRQLRELADWQRARRARLWLRGAAAGRAGRVCLRWWIRRAGVGGLFDPNCGHLHPLKYALAWSARRWGRAGPGINSPALRIEPGASETVVGEQVGAPSRWCWPAPLSGGLSATLRARIMPVGTYIIATAPLARRARQPCRATMRRQIVILCWIISAARPTIGCRLAAAGVIPPAAGQPESRHMRRDMLRCRRSWRTWRLTAAGRFGGHHPQPGAGRAAGGQHGLVQGFRAMAWR